ncbi:MAG: methionyl-tRNA formyltransferase [Clostridiales bacterium]|nr:methionyl-tRNA formyltransferase [Clostridiales bacterium]
MKVLFFGTPRFAEIILKGMLDANIEVVGVVCQSDKPAGRGKKMVSPKIVEFAKAKGLPVYQFEKLSQHIEDFMQIDYDLGVTASYGKILPKTLLDLKPIINVHPSMLPKYRGATPIQTALLNGDNVTGVTVMKTEVGMDDGDIFVQEEVEILPEEDYVSLLDRLAEIGLKLLLQTLKNLENGMAERTPQDNKKATFVKLIQKEDGLLDFNKSARELTNKVRAFCESPVAFFNLGEDRIKVYKARVENMNTSANVGQVIPDNKRFLLQTADGVFEILECQVAGGKRLQARDFLNGYRFKVVQV